MPRHTRPNVAVRHIAPLALLVASALVGLGSLITHPDGLLKVHSDLVADHLDTQTIFHDLWQKEHRVPLWRSDILSGGPALTNPQSLCPHLLHLLFALYLRDRVIGLVVWLQMLLAGIGGYYLGTVLALSAPAAHGGIAYALFRLCSFSFKTSDKATSVVVFSSDLRASIPTQPRVGLAGCLLYWSFGGGGCPFRC